MVTMYDALDASVIPTDAAVVGGYAYRPGGQWSAADWARFPSAKKVGITTVAGTVVPAYDACAWDAENGDGSPADLPSYHAAAKAAGYSNPWVYAGLDQWLPQLQTIAAQNGLTDIVWWISDATGVAHLAQNSPTQYKVSSQGIPYDLSLLPDSIPGFDTTSDGGFLMALTDAQQTQLLNQVGLLYNELVGPGEVSTYKKNVGDLVGQVAEQVGLLYTELVGPTYVSANGKNAGDLIAEMEQQLAAIKAKVGA